MTHPKYSERVVAFIDVLGFGALVAQLDPDPSLHAKLHRALSKIRLYKDFSLQEQTAQTNLEVSVFSDSIVISGASDNLHGVVWSGIYPVQPAGNGRAAKRRDFQRSHRPR